MGLFNPTNNRGRGSGDRKGHRILAKGLRAAKKRRVGERGSRPDLFEAVDSVPSSTTVYGPGTHTFTCPKGTDKLRVHLYGGGGAGGYRAAGGKAADEAVAGAGGAFVGVTLDEVVPGTQITFTVGASGTTGASAGDPAACGRGGDTFFVFQGVTLSAGGGGGGTNGEGMTDSLFISLTGNVGFAAEFGKGNFDGGPGQPVGATTGQEGAAGGTFGPKITGFTGIGGNTGNRHSTTFAFSGSLSTNMGRGGSGPNDSDRDNQDGNGGFASTTATTGFDKMVPSGGLVVIF